MPSSDTFVGNKRTVRKPHKHGPPIKCGTLCPLSLEHSVHSALSSLSRKEQQVIGILLMRLPIPAAASLLPFLLLLSCCLFSLLFLFFAFRFLFLSNFFLLIRHSSHSYLLSPHAWNKSLFSLCCLL